MPHGRHVGTVISGKEVGRCYSIVLSHSITLIPLLLLNFTVHCVSSPCPVLKENKMSYSKVQRAVVAVQCEVELHFSNAPAVLMV